jgi:glycosyltransferase involved in cell wall biosynthesis
MTKQRLYVFNLETNLDNPVLAFTHDWVRSFANQIDKVIVYSTHVGSYELPANVEIHEIGGGNLYLRVRAILRLLKSACSIIWFRKDSVVFHHMSVRSLVLPGILLRAMGVKQGLWYSHSAKPISLRVAARVADVIFSSTEGAVPIDSPKVTFVGHGLNLSKSETIFQKSAISRKGIVSLGRIAKIKNLDKLLLGISSATKVPKVVFIGPSNTNSVLDERLMELAKENNVNLTIYPQINHDEVLDKLVEFSMYYTGTPRSVDKSTIEAASVGCFIITMEKAAQKLTGMNMVWERLDQSSDLSIAEQIKVLENLNESERNKLRILIHQQAVSRNEVVNTTQKILSLMTRSAK